MLSQFLDPHSHLIFQDGKPPLVKPVDSRVNLSSPGVHDGTHDPLAPPQVTGKPLQGGDLLQVRQQLGKTLLRIRDAAVTCPQDSAAADVIYPLVQRVSGVPRLIGRTPSGQRFEYRGEEFETGLVGDHQLVNAALVIEAASALREKGFDIPQAALKAGLKRAVWHARFDEIPHGKTLVLDGAHNPQGADALADALRDVFPGARIAAVVGVLADKDFEGVMRRVLPLAERAYAVTPDSSRALPAEKLKECAERAAGLPVEVCGGVREGVTRALASEAEVTVVFGSLTLFHEIVRKDAGRADRGNTPLWVYKSRRGVQKPDNA